MPRREVCGNSRKLASFAWNDREGVQRGWELSHDHEKPAGCQRVLSAVVEEVNLKVARGLDKALLAKLVAGDWIARHQNLR